MSSGPTTSATESLRVDSGSIGPGISRRTWVGKATLARRLFYLESKRSGQELPPARRASP